MLSSMLYVGTCNNGTIIFCCFKGGRFVVAQIDIEGAIDYNSNDGTDDEREEEHNDVVETIIWDLTSNTVSDASEIDHGLGCESGWSDQFYTPFNISLDDTFLVTVAYPNNRLKVWI